MKVRVVPWVPSKAAPDATSPTEVMSPAAVLLMVIVSVPASVVMEMLVPATKVKVSDVASVTTLDWPETAMVVKTFWSPVLVPLNVVSPVKVKVLEASPVVMVRILSAERSEPGVRANVWEALVSKTLSPEFRAVKEELTMLKDGVLAEVKVAKVV